MTTFQPPIRRIKTSRGHSYKDANNTPVPGVTTILSAGIPKPQLITWAGNKSAELAVDNWEFLTALSPTQRLKWIQNARYESDNVAKNKGTRVHTFAEQVVQGHPAEFDPGEEEILRPYVENYIKFIDVWELDPILVEVVVVHYGAGRIHGYAGTLDLIADITNPQTSERERWLLDIKTGEKGIWPETAWQLAAYKNAQHYIDNDGNQQPMIPVQACGAIHVTADDAVLIPTNPDMNAEAFNVFLYAQRIREIGLDKDDYLLPAVQHPASSTAKVTW